MRYKCIILGNSSVGKTCVFKGLNTQNKDKTKCTILDMSEHDCFYNNQLYKVIVFDTAGAERFKSLSVAFYRNVSCVVYVYDITNRKSFEDIKNWMNEISFFNESNPDNEPIKILLANKKDKEEERIVSTQEGKHYAKDSEMLFYEISAINENSQIKDIFSECFNKIHEKFNKVVDNKEGLMVSNSKEDVNNDKKISLKDKICLFLTYC